ncbi:MAG: hypothetical protein K2I77_03485 [Anaeroplasmataceae bacterium]|nr:hypothetical protein [Anaeroplasmataceae bacterium]
MNQRQTILYYRTNRLIKGRMPAIINLKRNIGKIYMGTQADFILSMGKDCLSFQRLSFFTKKLLPRHDFDLALSRIRSYELRKVNVASNCLTLYTFEKFFIEMYYFCGTSDTSETESNIKRIISRLEELGVKEYQ